jgi:YrbI family 3-deoxy-D-manno-octulosonate 8-phosphate phosphatase
MSKDTAAKIKMLILDVDGVMTNGRITINEQGEEIKTFHAKDGQGLRLLMDSGIDVVIISGRDSRAVERRAADLGIKTLFQGIQDKGPLCAELIQQRGFGKEEVCCMGDDLPDIPMFRQVGLAVAVADAAPEVRDSAHWVTHNNGGMGAVREVCERILKAQGLWSHLIAPFINEGKYSLHIKR